MREPAKVLRSLLRRFADHRNVHTTADRLSDLSKRHTLLGDSVISGSHQAGVGPGTLYRHFLTREELLQAVYRSELEKLAAAEQKFAQTMPPIEALRAWLLLFVDGIASKQLIAPALNKLVGDPKKVFEASYAQVHEAMRALVKRAIRSGDIRKDLDPLDLLRALVGVANVATSPDWQQSAKRLVEILITGSRPNGLP